MHEPYPSAPTSPPVMSARDSGCCSCPIVPTFNLLHNEIDQGVFDGTLAPWGLALMRGKVLRGPLLPSFQSLSLMKV
jgi:hypothetical protein